MMRLRYSIVFAAPRDAQWAVYLRGGLPAGAGGAAGRRCCGGWPAGSQIQRSPAQPHPLFRLACSG